MHWHGSATDHGCNGEQFRREGIDTMPSLFQTLLTPLAPRGVAAPAQGLQQGDDEGFALGWECANPALQFDGWEPAPSVPLGSAAAA